MAAEENFIGDAPELLGTLHKVPPYITESIYWGRSIRYHPILQNPLVPKKVFQIVSFRNISI